MGLRATLYFVRHGETEWNREARLQGQRDIPLNPLGRAQAAEAGRKLLGLVGSTDGLDFVSSPLSRTRETMELLRESAGLPRTEYRLDPRLAELSFGLWEGMTWREVRRSDPARAKDRERDKWRYVPPGGESYAGLAERALPAFEALDRDAVVVSHGGVARTVLNAYAGVDPDLASRVDIWQGRVLVIAGGAYRWV